MNETPEREIVHPAYTITLTSEEALHLGRLCAIWGQIDHFLMLTTTTLIAVDLAAGMTIMEDLTTGGLLKLFRKNRVRIPDDNVRETATKFCDDMGGLIERRNHVMHGLWGMYLPGKSVSKGKRACFYLKAPLRPLYSEEIPDIADAAARQSSAIHDIYRHVNGLPEPESRPTYWWGQHEPRVPKGMQITRLGPRAQGRPDPD